MDKRSAWCSRRHSGAPSVLTAIRSALPIIVIAGLAGQACGSYQDAPERPWSTGTSVINEYPPLAGDPVLLDRRFPDWETTAWLSKNVLCIMAARPAELRGPDQENQHVYCDPAPAALRGDGPPAVTMPMPQVVPTDPKSQEVLLIGTVKGAADTVDVTMFGVTVTGTVRRLPTDDHRHVGAYAVWLPRHGPEKDGMKLSDVTSVVARDDAGRVVAALP